MLYAIASPLAIASTPVHTFKVIKEIRVQSNNPHNHNAHEVFEHFGNTRITLAAEVQLLSIGGVLLQRSPLATRTVSESTLVSVTSLDIMSHAGGQIVKKSAGRIS